MHLTLSLHQAQKAKKSSKKAILPGAAHAAQALPFGSATARMPPLVRRNLDCRA
jgi:hypothetical protein